MVDRLKLRGGRLLLPLLLPAGLVSIWWIATSNSDSLYYPPLTDIVRRFWEDWTGEQVGLHLVPSVERLAGGFAIAIVFGVALGTLMGLSARARRDLRPVTEFMRATPASALVPMTFLLIGPGAQMEMLLIAFGSTWLIVVATTDGVRGTDPMMLDIGLAYGLSSRQRLWRIVLPAALPAIVAGIRVAVQLAVGMMIIANFVGSDRGLGFFVLNAQTTFDVVGTWAGLLIIGLVGFMATVPVLLVERHLLRWHRGWRASSKET